MWKEKKKKKRQWQPSNATIGKIVEGEGREKREREEEMRK